MHTFTLILTTLLSFLRVNCYSPAVAFTYTSQTQDFYSSVTTYGFKSVVIYAGDVELYCRGSAGSNPNTSCSFTGSSPNAFIYYTAFAKAAAAKYKNSGLSVYLNFDGRIGEYVPDFSKLTLPELNAMAAATADIVCNDSNVMGMSWDVEPFNNNQIGFFQELDRIITGCKKSWGIFTFAQILNPEMWTSGLGQSGVLLDSTYDLTCATCAPCKCVPPTPQDAQPNEISYTQVLTTHLTELKSLTNRYQKPYKLFIAGGGTTQIYTNCTLPDCTVYGGHQVFNQTCPWRMADWLQAWINVYRTLDIQNDALFQGVEIYDWSPTNNGGLLPTLPDPDFIQKLKDEKLM